MPPGRYQEKLATTRHERFLGVCGISSGWGRSRCQKNHRIDCTRTKRADRSHETELSQGVSLVWRYQRKDSSRNTNLPPSLRWPTIAQTACRKADFQSLCHRDSACSDLASSSNTAFISEGRSGWCIYACEKEKKAKKKCLVIRDTTVRRRNCGQGFVGWVGGGNDVTRMCEEHALERIMIPLSPTRCAISRGRRRWE